MIVKRMNLKFLIFNRKIQLKTQIILIVLLKKKNTNDSNSDNNSYEEENATK